MDRQQEWTDLLARHSGRDGIHSTVIPRAVLIRCSKPTEPLHALQQPAVCIIAQGRKQVMLGETIHVYDRTEFLVASVDVPIVGQILAATPDAPYLCFRLDLDPAMLGALLLEIGIEAARREEAPPPGLSLAKVTPELLDATIRLLRLLDTPRDIQALAPLAEREILYRLLLSEHSMRLRQIAVADSKLQQVNRAIGWIRRHFAEPFSIDAVAAEACMSPSALHQHFKAVTQMTPLQYQKQLRLQEARRLILSRDLDAASAGHQVGYESPSQFSREYARLFGAPPIRDIARLKAAQRFNAVAVY